MLTNLLSRYVSRLKGDDYRLDPRLPAGYLVLVVFRRVVMRIRGIIRFPLRSVRPFVGANVTLRAKPLMRFGRAVTFADGSLVDAASTGGVVLGDNVSVGRNTRIECTGNLQTLGVGIRVGNNVGLGTDSFYGCAGGISIGDDTIIGNYVTFHSENHELSREDVPIRLQGVTHAGITVGKNCWLGAKTTVLDGAVIEDGCVFAAGSVVPAGHYPANTIYAGVPARSIRSRASNGLKSA